MLACASSYAKNPRGLSVAWNQFFRTQITACWRFFLLVPRQALGTVQGSEKVIPRSELARPTNYKGIIVVYIRLCTFTLFWIALSLYNGYMDNDRKIVSHLPNGVSKSFLAIVVAILLLGLSYYVYKGASLGVDAVQIVRDVVAVTALAVLVMTVLRKFFLQVQVTSDQISRLDAVQTPAALIDGQKKLIVFSLIKTWRTAEEIPFYLFVLVLLLVLINGGDRSFDYLGAVLLVLVWLPLPDHWLKKMWVRVVISGIRVLLTIGVFTLGIIIEESSHSFSTQRLLSFGGLATLVLNLTIPFYLFFLAGKRKAEFPNRARFMKYTSVLLFIVAIVGLFIRGFSR